MPLKAAIDIGTNSTRLLLVNVRADGRLEPEVHHERLTKLGAGLDRSRILSAEAMNRVIETLIDYRTIITKYRVDEVRLFATSATRDAVNKADFISLIKEKTGFECRILSGEHEAKLSFLGLVSDLEIDDPFLVCDVGGGSSEFIFAKNRSMRFYKSLDIGSGRLTRQFLCSDPPTTKEVKRARESAASVLDQFAFDPVKIIGVGGSAAALALIAAGVSHHEAEMAHHFTLQKSTLAGIVNELAQRSIKERKKITGLDPDRADVLLGGALIYWEIMDYFKVDSMITSLRDLMYGIFLE